MADRGHICRAIRLLLLCVQHGQLPTCTFEDDHICGYTQDRTDDFDWRRDRGGTSTSDSGPDVDHTTDNSNGHYMYIEASSPRQEGDKARLISPPAQTGLLQHHVSFWYHMFGETMGSLKVYFKHGGHLGTSVFWEEGERGDEWIEGCLDISTSMTELQVVFEGIVGDDIRSDIAIDDVTFGPGLCPVIPLFPGSCDFEDDICEFHQDQSDQMDWKRGKRGTPTTGTGPSGDHTTGHGHFMYLETNSGHVGYKARLISEEFDSVGRQLSLDFWYEDHGYSVGALNVYFDVGGHRGHPVFTSTGEVAGWHEACINLPEGLVDVQVVLEAVHGNGNHGDIAIDDVFLTYGYCPNSQSHGIHTTTVAPHVTTGSWSQWSSFGSCSHTCGNAARVRTRHCNGSGCVGHSTEYMTCHLVHCPVNGHWGSWSSYGSCTVTCGHGYRYSHRPCNNPAPSAGGHACTGVSSRALSCTGSSACSVNGGWSTWNTWSQCSRSCDLGQITRHRSCDHPMPSGGGSQCAGAGTETHDCSNGPCSSATWSHWFDSPCSNSCGNGTMERLRHCSTGHDEDCTGNSYEQVPCSTAICVDGRD